MRGEVTEKAVRSELVEHDKKNVLAVRHQDAILFIARVTFYGAGA